MAGFMMKSFVLVTLVCGGAAAVLPTHDSREFAVGTGGALVRREGTQPQQARNFKREVLKKAKNKDTDLCDYNYEAGTLNTADCATLTTGAAHTDGSTMHRIEDAAMCREAALEECPDGTCVPTASEFEIDDGCFGNLYPMRCYMAEPVAPSTTKMWYFNNVGYTPTGLGGKSNCSGQTSTAATPSTPICFTAEFENGTLSTDGSTACPTGMQVIMHEDTCRSAATCLGICPQEQFRVINQTHGAAHNSHPSPKGCHINPDDGCAQFSDLEVADPTLIAGTPLCNLTIARGSEVKGGSVVGSGSASGSGSGSGSGSSSGSGSGSHAGTTL